MRSSLLHASLLVAGVAIGFVLSVALERDAPSREAASLASDAGDADPHVSGRATLDLEPPPESARRSEAPALPSIDGDGLGDALTRLAERLPPPTGEAAVTGRAVDEDGAPIADVTVVVTGPREDLSPSEQRLDPGAIGRAYDPSAATDTYTNSILRRMAVGLRPAGRTRTSQDGRFRLEGLAPGDYGIKGFKDGVHFAPTTVSTGVDVELLGRAVTSFSFEVVRQDGSSPEEATLAVEGRYGNRTQYLWTPDAPELRVTTSTVTVQALAGEVSSIGGNELRAPERSSIATFDRDANGPGPHTLELVPYPSVRVEVVPGPDAGQPFDPWCDLVRDDLRISVDPDDGHTFTAHDVTPGPYTVEVGRGDGPAEAKRDVVVGAGRTDVRVELGPLDPARYLIATCVDESGRPIMDVDYFGLSLRAGKTSTGTSIRAEARTGGEYWLSLERDRISRSLRARDEIDQLRMTAHSGSRGQLTKEVDPRAERVEFVFQSPCDLVLEVTGSLNAALSAKLETVPAPGESPRRLGQPADVPGDGNVAFTGLAPGPVRVVVFRNDSPRRLPVVTRDIELTPGGNRVRVEVEGTHDLTVLTPDRAGLSFALLREQSGEFERVDVAEAGSDERLVFEDLPPGRYRVERRSSLGAEFADYDVPCGEVVFEPLAIGGYEVVELPAGCPAEELGLRLGDVLVEADGVGADARSFLATFTTSTMRDEGAELVVRRGNALIRIPARFGDVRPERAILGHGARFEPRVR